VRECDVADPEADLIRLSVPADDGLRPVIEVAIAVLARRWGLSEDEVAGARAATAAAFGDVVGAETSGTVKVEVQALPRHLEVRIVHGGVARSLEAPMP